MSVPNTSPHCPYVMSSTENFFVKICGCGCVHLSFGAAVINLSPTVLVAVQATLGDVIKRFESTGRGDLLRAPNTGLVPEFTN